MQARTSDLCKLACTSLHAGTSLRPGRVAPCPKTGRVLPALLTLADSLVRRRGAAGAAPAARALGRALYARAFVEVADAGQRQGIVGQLVAHAGSGMLHEVAAAFFVFLTLGVKPLAKI